jgi:hypothetical protein
MIIISSGCPMAADQFMKTLPPVGGLDSIACSHGIHFVVRIR